MFGFLFSPYLFVQLIFFCVLFFYFWSSFSYVLIVPLFLTSLISPIYLLTFFVHQSPCSLINEQVSPGNCFLFPFLNWSMVYYNSTLNEELSHKLMYLVLGKLFNLHALISSSVKIIETKSSYL